MKFRISIILVLLSTLAFSQNRFGIKGGLDFVSDDGILEAIEAVGNSDTYDSENTLGFHLGLFYRIEIGGLFVQPEILYSNLDSRFRVNSNPLVINEERIDIPFNFGIKILNLATIKAGPVLSYQINNGTNWDNIRDLQQDDFTVGYQAGIGIDVTQKVSIDMRYEGTLTNDGASFFRDNTEFRVEQRPALLRLGMHVAF